MNLPDFLESMPIRQLFFFDAQMNYISPVKGYLNPKQIEIYLSLFKDDKYKNIKSQSDFDEFVKNFKSKVKV